MSYFRNKMQGARQMTVIDLTRHCLAYNKILKDNGMTQSSPPIATTLYLNVVEFLLDGPLRVLWEQNKRKKLKTKVHMNFIPFTVSSSCKPPAVEARSCLWITKFSKPITMARAAVGKSKIALQAPVAAEANHLFPAGALSCYLVTYSALWALMVAVTC